MKNLKKQFTDSFQEMRDLKVLVAAAMLLSITVVLGFYSAAYGIHKDRV